MPRLSRRQLADLSRNRGFLLKSCLILVGVALVLSAIVSSLPLGSYAGPDRDSDVAGFEDYVSLIRNPQLFAHEIDASDFRSTVFYEVEDGPKSEDYDQLKKNVDSASLDQQEKKLALLLLDALHRTDEKRAEAIEGLRAVPGNIRFRNEFLGDALIVSGDPENGIAAFRREGEKFPEATYSLRSAIIASTERKDTKILRELLSKPEFVNTLTPHEVIKAANASGDHVRIIQSLFRYELALMKSPHLVVALFTASIWFLILTIMGQFTRREYLWGIIAFVLGMFSAAATLYAVHLQETILNIEFHEEDSLANQLVALIAGIGLREELLKLLCFIPVAIGIAKYRSPVFALVAAALTGLGFAMMENLQYFTYPSDGFVAWHRLLSANALHFCLTGIVGFSFYQLVVRKGRGWENFLVDFLLVVIAHGLYDGFIMIPMFGEYGIITLVILALIAYRYLDLVREHMPSGGQLRKISPLGIFVLGAATLACGIMVFTAFSQSFLQATGAFANAIGGSLPIAFAFISRLRDL